MKARPLLRSLPVAGLVIAMAGFILGPATPAAAVTLYDLTVVKTGTGTGTVTTPANLAHINCGSDCTEPTYIAADTASLKAIPSPGSYFAGWSVSGTPDTQTISGDVLDLKFGLTDAVATDLVATAVFHLIGFPFPCPFPFSSCFGVGGLSVAKAGTGTGTVTSTDGLINCGSDCGQTYGGLTQVTLLATPGPSSSFTGWNVTGDATNLVGCGGLGSCTLLVNNTAFFGLNTLVTAIFNAVGTVTTATVPGVPDARCANLGVLCGTGASDELVGGPGINLILGFGGDDLCVGGPSADVINCGPGDDTIDGKAGSDTLVSTGGADHILGGPGNDHLSSGPGADTLRGGSGTDSCSDGAGTDNVRGCEN